MADNETLKAAELEYVKNNSPYALPYNPSDSGWSAEQIKQKHYKAIFYILEILQKLRDDLEDEDSSLDTAITELQGYFSSGIANKASADANGDVIDETYAKLAANNIMTGSNVFSGANTFTAANVHHGNETHDGVETYSGTTNVTGRIVFSGNANLFNIPLTTNSKNYFARVGITTGKYVTYALPYNYADVGAQDYTLITKEYVDTQLATKQDTLTFDATPTDSSTNPVTSGGVKQYIDNLYTTTLVYAGSLTAAQVSALDVSSLKVGAFYNVTDSGTISWTINGTSYTLEVLQGDNIAWTGTIWDKLTMDLSAYDDKFIAAGFFEISDYDEETGQITFVYNSDLYDMSYDSTTGILTITAN